MLTKAKEKELLVLYTLTQKQKCSLQKLSEHLDIPKRTVKELIRKLNTAISYHLGIDTFILSTAKGEILISPAYAKNGMMVLYKLRICYFKESQRFNYLLLLIEYPVLSKEFLLEELFISASYLDKLTNQINEKIKKYHLQVVVQQGKYSLTGDELHIRMYSYLFLADSFQGIEWPFQALSLKKLQKLLHRSGISEPAKQSSARNMQFYFLVAIFIIRIKHQQLLEEPPDDIEEILTVFREQQDFSRILQRAAHTGISEKQWEIEYQHFNLFMCALFPNWISSEQKIEVGQLFFEKNNELCHQVKELTKKLSQEYAALQIPEKQASYNYFILLLAVLVLLIGDVVAEFYTLYFPKMASASGTSVKELAKIQKIVDTVFPPSKKTKTFNTFLSELIYAMLHSETTYPLMIYIQITKSITESYTLQNRLYQLFNNQTILLTDNYHDADLIITDWVEASERKKHAFYFDSANNQEIWKKLTHLIQDLYLKKNNIIC
ncbi:M protein trans-acting positive regulator [Enterococcus faecalis 13-SD-W-01]|nr:M protein trans-acting positive regulator [Enterococcus faecalis 13-SD-W-01]